MAAGTVSPDDLVWWEGRANWIPLGKSYLVVTQVPSAPPSIAAPSVVPPQVAPVASSERTSGLAIGSLVSGILSLFIGFTFIVAIILGHMGLSEIRRNPGLKGRGMAIAGLVLGYLMPVLIVVSMIVLVTLGNQVRDTFKTINAQLQAAQTNTPPATPNGQ